MPIRPDQRHRYPKNWPEISLAKRIRSNWKCEGSPAYPDCRAENRKPHPVTGSLVVLTVGHLDHRPEHCAAENLRCWCQRCHNTYDAPHRKATRAHTAHEAAQTLEMFRWHTGGKS